MRAKTEKLVVESLVFVINIDKLNVAQFPLDINVKRYLVWLALPCVAHTYLYFVI
jgi:hypothetical protein